MAADVTVAFAWATDWVVLTPLAFIALVAAVIVAVVRRVSGSTGLAGSAHLDARSLVADTRPYSKAVVTGAILAIVLNVAGLVLSVIGLIATSRDTALRGRGLAVFGIIASTISLIATIVVLTNPTLRSHTHFG